MRIKKFYLFESFSDRHYISLGGISPGILANGNSEHELLMKNISYLKFMKVDNDFQSKILTIFKNNFPNKKLSFERGQESSDTHWHINPAYTIYNIPKSISELRVNIGKYLNIYIRKLEDDYILVTYWTNRSWRTYICDVAYDYIGLLNLLNDDSAFKI